MTSRRIGRDGPPTGAIALGCMGMSEFYDPPVHEREAIATIHRALDLGMTLIDTSDMYGRGANERLVGRALHDRRDRAQLATKGGIVRDDDPAYRAVDGRPEHIRAACEASLQRLGVDHVDLYYLHRVDPKVPIEETVGAMAELVAAGKARRLGLSEAAPETLRRAAATAPIAVLQNEYSLFTRDVESNGVLGAARELGITLVAYAPLGRGMLTGSVRSTVALPETDLRRKIPRFDERNLAHNLRLVDELTTLAATLECTPAQLALAWLLARGDDVIALPGCQRVAHAEENARAADVVLDESVRTRIDALFPPGAAAGSRLRDLRFVNR